MQKKIYVFIKSIAILPVVSAIHQRYTYDERFIRKKMQHVHNITPKGFLLCLIDR